MFVILPVAVILDVIVVVDIIDEDILLVPVRVIVGVTELEKVMETVGSLLEVTDMVLVTVAEPVTDLVVVGVAGATVPLTDAASFPTVISMPQAWGSVRVAEYTHVGFSFTPLIDIVAPHASAK